MLAALRGISRLDTTVPVRAAWIRLVDSLVCWDFLDTFSLWLRSLVCGLVGRVVVYSLRSAFGFYHLFRCWLPFSLRKGSAPGNGVRGKMMGRRALITDVTSQDRSYLSRASWLESHLGFVDSDMRTIAVLEAVILLTEHDQVAVH